MTRSLKVSTRISDMSYLHKDDLLNFISTLADKKISIKANFTMMGDGELVILIDYDCPCGKTHETCECYCDAWLLYGSPVAANYLRLNQSLLRQQGHLPSLKGSAMNDPRFTFEFNFAYAGTKMVSNSASRVRKACTFV